MGTFSKFNLEANFEIGDYIQIVIEGGTPLLGKILDINIGYLYVAPYDTDELKTNYGDPVIADAAISYDRIALIFKLDPSKEFNDEKEGVLDGAEN